MNFIIHPLLREKLHVSADLLNSYDLQKIVQEWSQVFNSKIKLHDNTKYIFDK